MERVVRCLDDAGKTVVISLHREKKSLFSRTEEKTRFRDLSGYVECGGQKKESLGNQKRSTFFLD